jgi:hypothetical protein
MVANCSFYASVLTDSIKDILLKIQHIEKILYKLKECYMFVMLKTNGLQSDCQEMLNSQTSLHLTADSISAKLKYFSELEHISLLLLTPGDALILDASFAKSLITLDECLEFCSQYSSYKDASIYKMRYRQCMTRCMTLIKMHVVDSLRKLTIDTRDKSDQRINNDQLLLSAVFIAKFRQIAPQVKSLINEIEIRCENHREYSQLLNDCLSCYFTCRKTLLLPVITKYLELLDSQQSLVLLAKSSCSYLVQVTKDESALFNQFFSSGDLEFG